MIQAIPDTLVPFAVWRFIGGLTFAGIFPAINAVLTMSTPPEDRGRIFGLSYAAQQVGSVIGPLVGRAGMAMYLPLKSVIFLGGFILLPACSSPLVHASEERGELARQSRPAALVPQGIAFGSNSKLVRARGFSARCCHFECFQQTGPQIRPEVRYNRTINTDCKLSGTVTP